MVGTFSGCGRQDAVHRLILPPFVVAGMLQNLSPEADLLEAVAASQFARRARLHENVVVVKVAPSTT